MLLGPTLPLFFRKENEAEPFNFLLAKMHVSVYFTEASSTTITKNSSSLYSFIQYAHNCSTYTAGNVALIGDRSQYCIATNNFGMIMKMKMHMVIKVLNTDYKLLLKTQEKIKR